MTAVLPINVFHVARKYGQAAASPVAVTPPDGVQGVAGSNPVLANLTLGATRVHDTPYASGLSPNKTARRRARW